jgi:hypothetical protein
VGGEGALPGVGVTAFEAAEAGPFPRAFDAWTTNVYDWLGMRPLMWVEVMPPATVVGVQAVEPV